MIMNNWFMKLPKQKEIFEILKRMFTPQEAEFLSSLYKMPVIDAKTVEQAAEQLGLDENYLTLSATKVGRFLLLAHRLRSNGCAITQLARPSLKGNGVYVGTLMGAASCLAP
jgi:hypothetical protein